MPPAHLPGVVVIHENRGLNPHIEDVTRRMALEGFVALAPDFLSPQGGTPQDEDQAREMIRQLDQQQTIQNALAAVDFLEGQEATTDRVGVIGFCWGGALANEVAVNSANIDAVVPFYGRQPASSEVSKIQAPLLLHYAGLDDRINAGIPDYEQALKDAGVDYTIHIYEGVNHAFHNDTSQERYNQEAAELAWSRTIDFLKQHLADLSVDRRPEAAPITDFPMRGMTARCHLCLDRPAVSAGIARTIPLGRYEPSRCSHPA